MNSFRKFIVLIIVGISFLSAKEQEIYSYLLNEKDFKELEAIEAILSLLDKQRDLIYPDTTSLLQAIQADMKDFPDAYPFVASQIRGKMRIHSEYLYKYCEGNEDIENMDCPAKKLWLDSVDLEILKGGLRNSGRFVVVAPQAIQIAKSMKDVEYPDSNLFLSAIRNRLMLAFDLCPANLTSKDQSLQALKLAKPDYEALKVLWTTSRRDLHSFSVIDSIRFAKKYCTLGEWQIALSEVDSLFNAHMRTAISSRYIKYYPMDTSLTIQWEGKDCGCTQVDAINGVIYGFFPYWAAQRETLRMDFGVLNRIAYYGLTFDESGMLTYANQKDQLSAQNTRERALDFVREAHRYNSRIDWVVEKSRWGSNWKEQTEEARRQIFRKLREQISEFVMEPLDDVVIRMAEKVSYSEEDPRTRGDGVSLYFRNYPTDSISTMLFEEFFRDLKKSLQPEKKRYYVNFIASRLDMSKNKGIYSYKTFRRLLENDGLSEGLRANANSALDDQIRSYLILFLEDPTSQSKQALRFEIDHTLQGLDHKILLRSLIPTVNFDYKSWAQLNEDIAYFNDAFYGIGLWPIKPTPETVSDQTCVEGANLPNCLRQDFFNDGWESAIPNFPSRFVCAHRWGLRLSFFVSVVMLFALIILTAFICPIRHRLAKNPLIYMAICVLPPCVLFTLLLYYDPVLAELRRGNWPFLITIVLVLIGGATGVAVVRYKKEKPVRTGL